MGKIVFIVGGPFAIMYEVFTGQNQTPGFHDNFWWIRRRWQ